MGLEYNLAEVSESQELQDLRLELAPRNQCRAYVCDNGGRAELIQKEDFDNHFRRRDLAEGPFKDMFGDRDGEPYNPNRQAFGKLKGGKVVYSELSGDNQEKVKRLLDATRT